MSTSYRKSPAKLLLLFFSIACAIVWTFSSLRPRYAPTPALEIWALNVGQGESVLLHEPSGKKLLYDGGPDDSVMSELGAVVPIWDRTIDLIILSHNHSDHLRGLIPVLENYEVKEIWLSGALYSTADFKAFTKEIKGKGLQPRITYFDEATCLPEQACPPATAFGTVSLQVYHPIKDMSNQLPGDQHDATVSVKATYKNESVFLAGDLNEQHEQEMIGQCPPPSCSLASTILQVPHHGSLTGLSPGFLAAVAPQAAFIPVGLNNTYGHPGPSTLAKLKNAGIPTYRTDTEGRIHFILYGNYFSVSQEIPS